MNDDDIEGEQPAIDDKAAAAIAAMSPAERAKAANPPVRGVYVPMEAPEDAPKPKRKAPAAKKAAAKSRKPAAKRAGPLSEAERQAKSVAALKEAGGRRVPFNLDADDLRRLAVIKKAGKHATDTAALKWALVSLVA